MQQIFICIVTKTRPGLNHFRFFNPMLQPCELMRRLADQPLTEDDLKETRDKKTRRSGYSNTNQGLIVPIHHNPKPGSLLRCDFTLCANPRDPEMCKSRPIIVIARPVNGLCIVVPLSTKIGRPMQAWHHEMDHSPWPKNLHHQCWAKCDLVLTVADWRLDRYFKQDQYGKRKYWDFRATTEDFAALKSAVIAALGFQT